MSDPVRKVQPAHGDITYNPVVPVPNELIEMAPGVFGIRVPLPFALNHVNLWLLEDGAGWTAIDAGLADQATRDLWQHLWSDQLGQRPIRRLIATHFHPDHMGLAGWLCARTGAEFWMSRTEWLQGRMLSQDDSEAFVEAGRRFDYRAGLSDERIEERAGRGNAYRRRVDPPPASYRRVRDGDRVGIGGREWRVLIGAGHAPEMICLFCAELNLLIAADQVLPRISPNVSVWPAEPEANPLGDFLSSLERFRALPEGCLVLPSHGRPFYGLHARIDQLTGHHEERLLATLDACREPVTPVELMTHLFNRPLDTQQFGFALGESIAHANHLVDTGSLGRELGDDGRLRYHRR